MTAGKAAAMNESGAAMGRLVARSNQSRLRAAVNAWINPRTYRLLVLGALPATLQFPWHHTAKPPRLNQYELS